MKRPHYAHPTAQDIFCLMSGAKCFTKFDASNPYWQTELDEESSKLLTWAPAPYHFLQQIFFFYLKSENRKSLHVSNMWDFSLCIEQDMVAKNR